ncbi:unnamed protein product [Dibothriocephalus latus]|uniref:PDEase domain-containing protein n=1 Tax=Dibothriocephalus latus TaxID=60516 RepID=A0A3P6U1U5_DIBLA|nr:unnamed protein product [Dibothriocephalus latus]
MLAFQGDEEKQQGLKPVQLMDRDLSHLLPDDQVGFYKAICLPCFEVVVRAIPTQHPMLEQALKNMAKWSELAALSLEEKKEAVSEILRHRPSAASQNSSTVSL